MDFNNYVPLSRDDALTNSFCDLHWNDVVAMHVLNQSKKTDKANEKAKKQRWSKFILLWARSALGNGEVVNGW